MSEERRRPRVINADKVIIRANEVIVIDERDRKRRHHRDRFDVAGLDDRHSHDDHRDHRRWSNPWLNF
ncbi:hypothetical protein LS684_11815 [Cytobacillus spongiae]|jgi:hypothetical protein|uniref:hypothetical protein n=1 Tax=Cytobacillus spongiae TaxID=2901381 RepID=UPI001F28D7EC|nr:hypothetical protein [Cytobacillus spongiae]UII54368.1 hypothetical protein LS684_11815 [Cytobacillus spongiae]